MPRKMAANQYEHCLTAMAHLLRSVGESHWAKWIETDISQWRASRDTSHHLSAYGGMGSFNDVWICAANSHKVDPAREPWANTLFNWLKSICHYMAQHPSSSLSASQLSESVGFYDAPLAAFVGGDQAANDMRGFFGTDPKLQGWRCLQCGHSETSTRSIEGVIADTLIPSAVFRACENRTVVELVDEVLAAEPSEAPKLREQLTTLIRSSDSDLNDRDGWMRPCPSCGSDDTAVYRWILDPESQASFVPSDDNLPLKQKRA